jgi:hypothetical protein
VDVVVYPVVLEALGIDAAGFGDRSPVEPDAVRLLRVSTRVAGCLYKQALEATVVLKAPVAATPEWPLILAPPPA